MSQILKLLKSKPLLVSFLSGILFSLSFMSKYLFWLTWIAAVPFMFALTGFGDKKILKPFLATFLFALGFYIILYTWFLSLHPLDYMGFEETQSMFLVIGIWLAISLAQSLQMSLAGLVYGLINPKGMYKPFVFALLWAVVEWAQGLGDFAMTWGKLAMSQYWYTPNIQILSLFGSLALAFLIMAVNGLIGLYFERLFNGVKKNGTMLTALSLVVANLFLGSTVLAVRNAQNNYETVKIASVQCNFPSDKKWGARDSEIFAELKENSDKAVSQGANIIIWPESALKEDLMPDKDVYTKLSDYARNNNIYLVTGGYTNITTEEDYILYNSVVVFAPNGEDYPVYIKQKLVPFAEYMPLKWLTNNLEFMKKLNLLVEMTPGKEAVVFDLNGAKLSSLICFDSIFPRYSYNAVRKGAEILAVSTNDSWFLGSVAVSQHTGHAVLRAVENNRFMLRSANSGESSIISNEGTVLQSLRAGTSGYVIDEIPLIKNKTLYTLTGDWLFLAIAFAMLLISVLKFRFSIDIFKKIFAKKQPKNL